MAHFCATLFAAAAVITVLPSVADAKSGKRGVCWDESTVALNEHHARLMSSGVSWVYNWGASPVNGEVYSSDLRFVPMAWNGSYDISRLRSWLESHPETEYILGFNEPNFADQACMTPAEAVDKWPELESLANEFGVKLVAPALNFSGSQVGGRVWSPYEWYDEFFRLRPEAKVDCLAMHCYMNWYSSNTWLATEYFYSDLFNSQKECYGRYPDLAKFLAGFKDANGHYPRMMLTEFCSWENDGTIENVDFQIDQMTQKVQKLEQSDLVEGYAWFIANNGNGSEAYPYMSMFLRNSSDSGLSDLGKVYVDMSAFDTSRYYRPDELICAKDYVDATTDSRSVKVRPNTESVSADEIPLQIEIPASAYPEYLVEIPSDGEYGFSFHISDRGDTNLILYIDSKKDKTVSIDAASGEWRDISLETTLMAGKHRIMLYNSGDNPVVMNSLTLTSTDGVYDIVPDDPSVEIADIFSIQGVSLGKVDSALLSAGVYIVRMSDGSVHKIVR